MAAEYNWTEIRNKCPEYVPSYSNVTYGIVAMVGVVLNCHLIAQFKKQLNGSVFLFALAFTDVFYCLLYLYNYPIKSVAMFFESDFLAEVHLSIQYYIKPMEKFVGIFVPLLMMYIIHEKFLWTCTSKIRQRYSFLTVNRKKSTLTAVTAVYAIVGTVLSTWNLEITNTGFCDVTVVVFPSESRYIDFLQNGIVFFVLSMTYILTFPFTLLVIVGVIFFKEQEESEDGIQMENVEDDAKLIKTNSRLRKSIVCMLIVYFLYFLRGVVSNFFIHVRGSDIYGKNVFLRNERSWYYDFMNVLISGSRIVLYYVFCQEGLIVDYPPNAIQTPQAV
ncbi:hypothetical protein GCK72_020283 [Caenorhabditis remanei]|uniref:G-protein coupled receptors family 1 profile domain-containing protein n=1 Tax=Caenorhabditis remanei TaxID=31234 RepID=A0A6A5GG84_CAERE|nr:hypothetical protein GCK72_020283 [Caenorhabditis remanei]KAF1753726.1 hypothetical protein GCK72_020283 [Caenorhabditis remanei]